MGNKARCQARHPSPEGREFKGRLSYTDPVSRHTVSLGKREGRGRGKMGRGGERKGEGTHPESHW